MRRTLLFVVGLALALSVAEGGVRAAAPYLPDPAPWPTPETRVKSAQMAALGCVHTVLLGTSVTEAAVIPEMLPVDAYNAALPFATPGALQLWYSEFVAPALCPERVVIGLPLWASWVAPDPGMPGRLESGLQAVQDYLEPQNEWKRAAFRSELFRRRTQIKSLAEQWMPQNRPEESGLLGPRGNQLGYRNLTLVEFPPERTGEVNPIDPSSLGSLLGTVAESGATPVLLIEPALCSPDGFCVDDDTRISMTMTYQAIAERYSVGFIDAGVPTDRRWFADASHLNGEGSRRFTHTVMSLLEERAGR